jgi:DNA primase large subunit
MMRQDSNRIDPKRRAVLDHKKKQFAAPSFKQQDYPHRLNFYDVPPTAEITLEEFEQWAIDRLKGKATLLRVATKRIISSNRSFNSAGRNRSLFLPQ